MRDAGSLAKVMAVDDAKHGVRGGKGLPATGPAMSPIPVLVKRPRFKTPRADVCNHAPENTQNRAARCCYATLSRLTSPQRQLSSAYVPYLPISPHRSEAWQNIEQKKKKVRFRPGPQ